MVTSVPLHSQRQRQRGFNQSDLLARACARHLRAPYRSLLLMRTRATPPQVGLSAAERRKNVEGAFGLAGRAERHVAGKRILLVDDVTTTGSTLDAAAAALRGAHPATIWGVAVSRPELQEDHHDGQYWHGMGN
jgi:ComF family protein